MQYRTHTCNELRLSDAGKQVRLSGWMENIREVSGNLAFIVLRDFYGYTQLVVEDEKILEVFRNLNKETVVSVTGAVRERTSKNPNLDTGDIEVVPDGVEVLGKCRYNALPFQISRSTEADETLRLKYRNSEFIKIEEVEHPKDKKMTPIPNLSKFLDFIGFIPEKEGYLQKGEIEYLTGGWFEEYVYYFIKATLNPQDIAMGVHISNDGLKHDNELDVCFMKANKLYVIECKTGVYSESLFNDIVYKVCALKEVLLGTSNSYIFSLKNDYKGEWKKTANYMDIIFCDYSDLTSPVRMNDIIHDMAKVAHEEIQH